MTHGEAALCFKLLLLLLLHAAAPFGHVGRQQWPVPYRYDAWTPSPARSHVTDRKFSVWTELRYFNRLFSGEVGVLNSDR